MNHSSKSRRKSALAICAALQILLCALIAVLLSYGFGNIGNLLIAAVAAILALQILVSEGYLYILSFTVAISAAFLIGGMYSFTVCLFALPAGLLLSLFVKRRLSKLDSTVYIHITYAVLFAALFLSAYIAAGNEFSVAAIIKYFSDIVDEICASFKNSFGDTIESLATQYGMTTDAFYEQTDALFAGIKMMLPSLFIIYTGIMAYITTSLFRLGTRAADCELLLPDPKWEILPSNITAIVYIASYTIYVFAYLFAVMFSGGGNLVLIVCENIVNILTPLMILMGLKWLVSRKRRPVFWVIAVGSIIIFTQYALILLALMGVREIFRRRELMKKTMSK